VPATPSPSVRPTPGDAAVVPVSVAAPVGGTRRAILDLLKRGPGTTVPALAQRLSISGNAVRQHLDALADAGLVTSQVLPAAGPGRPPLAWNLTPSAAAHFPDSHGELAVALLEAIGRELGPDAVDRVVASRVASQESSYRSDVPARGSLRRRVEALAARRTAEGYEAEVLADGGDLLLVERHCPISAAAQTCAGLCGGELDLFRRVLGDDVRIERTQHLLAGDTCCAYRIGRARP
jgi:predicted ArsR family transcriptional regulator